MHCMKHKSGMEQYNTLVTMNPLLFKYQAIRTFSPGYPTVPFCPISPAGPCGPCIKQHCTCLDNIHLLWNKGNTLEFQYFHWAQLGLQALQHQVTPVRRKIIKKWSKCECHLHVDQVDLCRQVFQVDLDHPNGIHNIEIWTSAQTSITYHFPWPTN